MNRQIVYLLSANPHMPYLVVSLETLREYWQGPVIVYAYPESHEMLLKVATDGDLAIEPRKWEPSYKGKNGQFINKILLMRTLEDQLSLYLDADTSVHGNLDSLFDVADSCGFAATQWNDWVTVGTRISGRIRRLQPFPEIDQELVGKVLANPYPSVNGGVFACKSSSPVLSLWYKWTMKARSIFIADETVLHVMMPKFFPTEEMTVYRGGCFNCSPMHQPKSLADEDVAIYHYHGDSNCRPMKSSKGFDMWMPMYHDCMIRNVGGMADWIRTVSNKHLEIVDPRVGLEL